MTVGLNNSWTNQLLPLLLNHMPERLKSQNPSSFHLIRDTAGQVFLEKGLSITSAGFTKVKFDRLT